MINEQRELETLAKALKGRGHTKQASVVSELSLIKEAAAPSGAPDLDNLKDLWDKMITAGWKPFKGFIGTKGPKGEHEDKKTDAYKGQDTQEWKRITTCVTNRYKKGLSGGGMVAARGMTLKSIQKALGEPGKAGDALNALTQCTEDEASTETEHDGGMSISPFHGWGWKIKNVSQQTEDHKKELYDWQKAQPVMWYFITHPSFADARKAFETWLNAHINAQEAIKKAIEDAAKAKAVDEPAAKALKRREAIMNRQSPGIDGVSGKRVNNFMIDKKYAKTVTPKGSSAKAYWHHHDWQDPNTKDGVSPFGMVESEIVFTPDQWKTWGNKFPPLSDPNWKRIPGTFKKESSKTSDLTLKKTAAYTGSAGSGGGSGGSGTINPFGQPAAPSGSRRVTIPSSMTEAGIKDNASGKEFRAYIRKTHPAIATAADLDAEGPWNNKHMVKAWKALESKGIKWTVAKGEIKESEPEAYVSPESTDTLRGYLNYPAEAPARDKMTAEYKEAMDVTRERIAEDSKHSDPKVKDKLKLDIEDFILSGTPTAKELSEAYQADTKMVGKDEPNAAQRNAVAKRLRLSIRMVSVRAKREAAQAVKDAEAKRLAEEKEKLNSVSSADYYLMAPGGGDWRNHTEGNQPAAGTLWIRKYDGEDFYQAFNPDTKKMELTSLKRRKQGFGLPEGAKNSGEGELTDKERNYFLAYVVKGEKNKELWKEFFKHRQEHRREQRGEHSWDPPEKDKRDFDQAGQKLFGLSESDWERRHERGRKPVSSKPVQISGGR